VALAKRRRGRGRTVTCFKVDGQLIKVLFTKAKTLLIGCNSLGREDGEARTALPLVS
jgi:hypothetical protein